MASQPHLLPSAAAGLRIDHVSVEFGGLKAVNDLSLSVGAGEFVSVVGPNGAGKSTLIQTITGFTRARAGRILFQNHRLDNLAPEAIAARGIARTFQTSRVFPALTVRESVMIGTQRALIGGGRHRRQFGVLLEPLSVLLGLGKYRRRHDEACARAEGVMRLFGDRLWARRDDPAYSLSYANRRRLDIARALVAQPDLLLLDEPMAGMNPTESHELADLLLQLRAQFPAMTIVMVEHKLDIVRRLTRRTVVMGHGQVIVDDTPETALADPRVASAYLGDKRGRDAAVKISPGAMHVAAKPDMAEDAGPAVELDVIDVFYGPVQALFGVSIRVRRGETVGVLGGNASGKSTTIKSVLGLVRARRGTVRLFGKPLNNASTADVIEAGVASIPEGRRMFPELTVRENLLMGAYPRRLEDPRNLGRDLESIIAEFPWLSTRLRQMAGTLSGGEQQMVAMARAWLRQPTLLCIDEPSMGLSPKMVDQVYEILLRWKSQGLTILMVEQSANRALELVDRAYILRNGVVILEGTAADLIANPQIQEAYLGGAATQDRINA